MHVGTYVQDWDDPIPGCEQGDAEYALCFRTPVKGQGEAPVGDASSAGAFSSAADAGERVVGDAWSC